MVATTKMETLQEIFLNKGELDVNTIYLDPETAQIETLKKALQAQFPQSKIQIVPHSLVLTLVHISDSVKKKENKDRFVMVLIASFDGETNTFIYYIRDESLPNDHTFKARIGEKFTLKNFMFVNYKENSSMLDGIHLNVDFSLLNL